MVSQGTGSVAIGLQAGQSYQAATSVAIGYLAGAYTQGSSAVAIGNNAGYASQGFVAIAIGYQAGQFTQGTSAVAIGNAAGNLTQSKYAIAIGQQAGNAYQATNAIAVGFQSGFNTQGENAIAIGNTAGNASQGTGAVAIGILAGSNTQGANAIAIGANAGINNQPANSIVINASATTTINAPAASSTVIFPIRTIAQATQSAGLLFYTASGEVIQGTSLLYAAQAAKTFVIDHPKNTSKYLVHACLEGPESGVYYRGKGEITNSVFTTIQLPDYVDKLAGEFTIQITAIYDGKVKIYNSTEVINNEFQVFGENGRFFWHVHGKRGNIEVEPFKHQVIIKGDGPYRWIQ